MKWIFSLAAPFVLLSACTGWQQFYFGAGQSSTQTAIHKFASSSGHLPEWLLSHISLPISEFCRLLFPSFSVLLSSLLAASAYAWPLLQSGDSDIDWIGRVVQFSTLVGAIIAIVISIRGYQNAGARAIRTDAEAANTIAKLVLRVMSLENEMALLKTENGALRARVIELESKLPNEK